jgi:ABC-type nitrate/sulfonate/bicarbonate transport system substrate-binding protein
LHDLLDSLKIVARAGAVQRGREVVKVGLLAGMLACAALATGMSPALAAETLTMVTTGKGSAQQWPIFIAIAKGYMGENGVTLDLVGTSSTAAAMQQLAAGSADIASGGLTDPLRAIDKGAPISLLRVEAQVPPYTLWAKPTIKSVADLRGKLIIIGGTKDITRIYLERTLIPNGVKPGEFDMIFAGTTTARFAALSSGAVDAAILVPPLSFKAKSSGLSLVANVADYVGDLPFTGYAANTAWAKTHKALLLGFLTAMAKGVDWFYMDENRTDAIDILVNESGSSREDVEMAYDYYRTLHIFDHKGLVEASSVGNLIKAMQDMGDLEGSLDVGRFIDPDITSLAAQVK